MSNNSQTKFMIFDGHLLNTHKIVKVLKEDTASGCQISIRTLLHGDSYLNEVIKGNEECIKRWQQLKGILKVSE